MLHNELFAEIVRMPVIDVHSHINRDCIAAKSLGELLNYHMMSYPMKSSGPPSESGEPAPLPRSKMGVTEEEWFDRWPLVANTGFAGILREILKDLYEYDGPITRQALPRMREAFDAKASRKDWAQEILRRGNVVRVLSSDLEVNPLAQGQWDGNISFTIEKGLGGGTQEFHTWRSRLHGISKRCGVDVRSFAALCQAAEAFYSEMDWKDKHALVAWISSMVDFSPLAEGEADKLIAAGADGEALSPQASRLLEGQLIRALCHALRGKAGVFQLCYGVQFIHESQRRSHPVPRAYDEFASGLGHLLGEFPDIHFNMLNGYEPHEPVWCGLTQAYGNFSLACFWWETFYPSVIENALVRRLDMVPLSRLMAFFSDGRSAEYIYGRLRVVQRSLAWALANKIERGYYTTEQALGIARHMMHQSAQDLFFGSRT